MIAESTQALPSVNVKASDVLRKHLSDIASKSRRPQQRHLVITQLVKLQKLLFDQCNASGIKPIELASCVRAFKEAELLRLIEVGTPLPGSLRPESPVKKSKVRSKATMSDPTAPVEPPKA